MKISHELPLDLLRYSKIWNDYEYCLPHLLDKYSRYKDHFLEAKSNGRFIIMDNGLFEGVTHTKKDYLEKIQLLEPNIFIVPDSWNDHSMTYKKARQWVQLKEKNLIPSKTHLMVVIQGSTILKMKKLFNACVKLGYDHFAFNHSSIVYQKMSKHKNKLVNQMFGRIQLVSEFESEGLLKDKYIHLLGCSLYQEFGYYKGYNISSMDTSNPVICGNLGIEYDGKLIEKPIQKIEELMDERTNNIKVIGDNVNHLKLLTN